MLPDSVLQSSFLVIISTHASSFSQHGAERNRPFDYMYSCIHTCMYILRVNTEACEQTFSWMSLLQGYSYSGYPGTVLECTRITSAVESFYVSVVEL